MTFTDIIIVSAIIILLVAFSMPAKVEIKEETIHFKVWPFLRPRSQKLAELEYYHLKIGLFPVYFRFKDGTVFKWTSFPLSQHVRIKTALQRYDQTHKLPLNNPADERRNP